MARTAKLPPASPTPRFQVRHLIAGFSAVFGLACLVILGALFNIASTLDQQERQRSAFHANQALEQRLLASRQFLSSYAVWDAAFEHLSGQADWQWAYEEKNIGESLYSASGYEGVFVVENDRTTYALFKGQPSQACQHLYRHTAATDHRTSPRSGSFTRANHPFRAVQRLAGRTQCSSRAPGPGGYRQRGEPSASDAVH